MHRESFESKLNIPRSLEGESQKEILDALQELSSQLEQENPQIVGIAPYGSVMRGSSVEGSDIDVVLLFDKDKPSDENEYRIIERAIKIWQGMAQERNITPDLSVHLRNINAQNVQNRKFNEDFAALFLTVTGSKIHQYRELWSNRIKEMSDDQRQLLV